MQKTLLHTIVEENRFQARAVVGIFPANGVGEDTEIYGDAARTEAITTPVLGSGCSCCSLDAARTEVIATLHHLRQQTEQPFMRPNLSLGDFIAPKATKASGLHRGICL